MPRGIYYKYKDTIELYEERKQLSAELGRIRAELIDVDREIQRRSGEHIREIQGMALYRHRYIKGGVKWAANMKSDGK